MVIDHIYLNFFWLFFSILYVVYDIIGLWCWHFVVRDTTSLSSLKVPSAPFIILVTSVMSDNMSGCFVYTGHYNSPVVFLIPTD